ncbi:MAG: oligosaccharide flippase family protein [Candidatus Krumholzibacteria bacterium]|nr:oligosaccharide flippase family protein [Candidatus Krumholzibacteria bacterium]
MGGTTEQVGVAMAWSVLARAGRFALGIASSIIVVRSLGEHDYGVLSVVRTVLMFAVVVAGAGLGQAVLKFLPALRVDRAGGEARALLRGVTGAHVAVWALVAATCYAGRGAFESVFAMEGLGVLVAAAVALALFEILFTLFAQVLNASFDTRRLAFASLASHVVYIALLAVLLPRGHGVMGVIFALAAGNLVACAMVAPRLRRATSVGDGRAREGVGAGRLARYAVPFAAIGVLNIVVWRQSETVLLAHYRSAAETGYFDLAYRLPQTILEFVPGTVWPIVMAGVSEWYARSRESLGTAIDRYYRMLFMLCAPICATGAVLGGRAIVVLFGESMAPAAVPAQIFFAVFTVSFLTTPLSMALYVMEKTHVNLLVYLGLALANVGLDLLLIPRYGVAGAVAPVAIVIAVSPFVYHAVLSRHMGGVRIPFRFIGKCFMASSPVVLLIPALRFVDGAAALAVALVVALVLVLLGFKWTRVIGDAERGLLRSVPVPGAARILKFLSS